MTIGDDQLLISHFASNSGEDGRLGNPPQAVAHTVFICQFYRWWLLDGQSMVNLAGWVRVKHEDLAEVGAGSSKQIQAISFWLGESLLMTMNNSGRIVLEFSERDEATPLLLGTARQRELLT